MDQNHPRSRRKGGACLKRLAALLLALLLLFELGGCAVQTVDADALMRILEENTGSDTAGQQQTSPPEQAEDDQTSVDLSTYVRPLDETHVQTGVIELDGEAAESMYVDNELVLIANDGTAREDIEKLAALYGAEIVGCISEADLYQLELPGKMTVDELSAIAALLSELPDVLMCSCNLVAEIQNEEAFYPNDLRSQYYEKLEEDELTEEDLAYEGMYHARFWGHDACYLPQAWQCVKLVNPNPKILMGLVDDSMDASHYDLDFPKVFWWKERYNPYTVAETFPQGAKHGTHVAGIMGAKNNNGAGIPGVALNASLIGVSVRTNDDLDKGYLSDMLTWIGAVSSLLNSGVKVINISLGMAETSWPVTSVIKSTAALAAATLGKYVNKDVDFLIVTAAGNSSTPENFDTNFANIFANISEEYLRQRIIVVGNAARGLSTGRYRRADSSCYKGGRVDIAAPGDSIYSTVPSGTESNGGENGCDYLSGTSMASPFVAGLAGLVWEANPDLSPEEVKRIIVETADIDVEGSDVNMVNAEAAVLRAIGYDPRPEEEEEPEEIPADEPLGEDELAARFRAEMVGTEDFFVCDDFDGDGTLEAFGGSGEADGTNWWRRLHVYFISSYGDVSEAEHSWNGIFGEPGILEFGTKRFLCVNSDAATGIGYSVDLLGVRNGQSYVPAGMQSLTAAEKDGALGLRTTERVWSDYGLQPVERQYLFDEATGEFVLQEAAQEQEIEVVFDHRYEAGGTEYAVISGVRADGTTAWTLETSHLPAAQCDGIVSIGICNGLYYYTDGGVVAVHLNDGSLAWKNTDAPGLNVSIFDEDGTLYYCCNFDLDFVAIDPTGKTIRMIQKLAPESLWPDKIEIEGGRIKITETFNNGRVYYVDMDTFEVSTQ